MRVLVVGFGNSLMGDDGFGPAVLAYLRGRPLPSQVRLEEGHTDATHLLRLWRGEPGLILLDALSKGAPPGTVYRLDRLELFQLAGAHRGVHHLSLPQCLRWVTLAEPKLQAVKMVFFGVEPADLKAGFGLSPPVAAAVPAVGEAVLELMRQWSQTHEPVQKARA